MARNIFNTDRVDANEITLSDGSFLMRSDYLFNVSKRTGGQSIMNIDLGATPSTYISSDLFLPTLTSSTTTSQLYYNTSTGRITYGDLGAVSSATGTANQVLVNGTSGSAQTGALTFTLPQSIATTSSPTFAAITATGSANSTLIQGTFQNTNAGTAAANEIRVLNDTSLGLRLGMTSSTYTGWLGDAYIFNSANAGINFGTNNMGNRLYIANSGNVGIGTASPPYQVTVGGNFRPAVYLTSTTAGATVMGMQCNSFGALLMRNNVYRDPVSGVDTQVDTSKPSWDFYSEASSDANSAFVLRSSASGGLSWQERFRVTGAGLVGIGTSTPGFGLHVSNNNTYNSRFSSGVAHGVITQWESSAAGGRTYQLHSTANSAGEGAGKFIITDLTAGSLTRLAIDSAGNVGINTTNPLDKLHVNVGNIEGMRIQSSNCGALKFFTDAANANARNWMICQQWSDNGDFAIISSSAQGWAPTDITQLHIARNGSVGLGTTTPSNFRLNSNGYSHFGDAFDGSLYGTVQITRPASQGSAHHLSFIRNGTMVAGMGFRNNSSTLYLVNAALDNTSTRGINIETNGHISGAINSTSTTTTFTPTFNTFTRITSVSAGYANWTKVNSVVHVSFWCQITVGTTVSDLLGPYIFRMTVPIASIFGDVGSLAGTVSGVNAANTIVMFGCIRSISGVCEVIMQSTNSDLRGLTMNVYGHYSYHNVPI
jgi:hypothetical protein